MSDTDILSSIDTEKPDPRSCSLDTLTSREFVALMNVFDREAADAVQKALPQIAQAIDSISKRLSGGGRLVYIGAGTSGRLGVLDASECPPTFGVPDTLVQGIIAGGDRALRYAIEGAEDDESAAEADLKSITLGAKDALVAISASGYAPYCVAALRVAHSKGALTVSLACNKPARISAEADIAIEVPTGAEILSGSTRLKAGTATKMVLNMLSTGIMTQLGKVYKNLMVDVRATNVKLKDRVVRIVMDAVSVPRNEAEKLLEACNQEPKTAILMYKTGKTPVECREALDAAGGVVSSALQWMEMNGLLCDV